MDRIKMAASIWWECAWRHEMWCCHLECVMTSSQLQRQGFDIAPQMSSSLDYVYNANQEQAFHVNIAFGYVLVHNETSQLCYFVAHQNWMYLDHPRRIDRPSDMRDLQQKLDNSSILEHIINQRCDIKWKPLLITNILIYVYHLGWLVGLDLFNHNTCPSGHISRPTHVNVSQELLHSLNKLLKPYYNVQVWGLD